MNLLLTVVRASSIGTAVAVTAGPSNAVMIDTPPLVHEGVIDAPPSEVWKVFSTAEGFKRFGVAHCEVDLRIGGAIRSHYDPKGVLGDDGTIQHEILAFEPERMIAFRIARPPVGFPFPTAYKSMWSVATIHDLGDGRSRLRLAGMGYTDDEESAKMREFFRTGNDWSMRRLQNSFGPAETLNVPAEAHAEDPSSPIDVSVLVRGPRAQVWTLLSTSDGWKQTLGVQSRIEIRPDGPFEIYFGSEAPEGSRGSEGCRVLSFVPGEMLSFSWNAPPTIPAIRALSPRTWVVIELEDVSAALTRVRLRHLGWREQLQGDPALVEDWKKTRAYFVSAWPRVQAKLQEQFTPPAGASGKPQDR